MKKIALHVMVLLLSFSLNGCIEPKADQTNEQKVVFDLTTGSEKTLMKHLVKNVKTLDEYYKSKNIEHKIAVIISGDSYMYFIKDIKNSPYRDNKELEKIQISLQPKLKALHVEHGVNFYMCKNGMRARKILKESLYNYVEADKTKSVYLIELQNRNYAYLPIH